VQRYNLALIGFGGVNRALAELLRDENARFEAELGIGLRVVAITDLAFGSLDLASVLSIPRDGTFAVLPGGDAQTCWGIEKFVHTTRLPTASWKSSPTSKGRTAADPPPRRPPQTSSRAGLAG
jgi:hypothetical protein